MAKHFNKSKKILNIYKMLETCGFIIEKTKKGKKIIHIVTNEFYFFHYSDKGYHPLRRWVANIANIEI